MEPTRPNIVVIIMDDLCPGDLSHYGNRWCRTPAIDRLAREGVACERHCSGPLCSPARASLMTGRYHLRTRVIDTWLGRTTIDPDEVVLPEVLGRAGYATGCFGKWHLGDTWPCRPEDRFDRALVHRGGGIGQHGDHLANWERESYDAPWLYRDGEPVQVPGYCTDIFGEATCDFIRANRDRPFFACLATNAPHTPLQIGEEWWRPHREAGVPETWAKVYGMVENIDRNVARVLETLEACGIADDTLVLFCSDHGPCFSSRDPEGGMRPNLDLRSGKGSMYEGGIRVPAFWRWPKGLPAGQRRHDPTHPIDVFCTLCAVAGGAPPDDRAIDGVDLLPYLRGEEGLPPRELFMQWHRGDRPEPGRNMAVIDGVWKLVQVHECAEPQLYQLDDDPREERDIAREHPRRVARMAGAYQSWFEAMAATRPDAFANAPIPVGRGIPTQVLTRNDWRVDGGDDWSDRGQGHWDLAVRDPGCYRAVLHFTSAPDASAIRLEVGGRLVRCAAEDGHKRYEFALELPAGATRLRADAAKAAGRQAVFHVELGPEPVTAEA